MAATGDYYYDTVFNLNTVDGDAHPLAGISVTVTRADGFAAQIYNDENLSSVKSNPFTTDTTGEVAFWAGLGEYRIALEDSQTPARIGPRTITWMSLPFGDFSTVRFTGEIIMSGRLTPPLGWLVCDGAAVPRTEYARLFAAVGTQFGIGDGASTFNLPDMRGRTPVGVGPHTDVFTLGNKDAILPANRTPRHTHGLAGHTHTLSGHSHSIATHAHSMQGHTHGITVDAVTGQVVSVAGDLGTTVNGEHSHTFVGGLNLSSDSRASTASNFISQALYIPGFNSGGSSLTAPMDATAGHSHGTGGHGHTIPDHAHTASSGGPSNNDTTANGATSTGVPSSDITSVPSVPNTLETISPFQVVNFLIKT